MNYNDLMELRYYTSAVIDGSMKSPDKNHETVLPARRAFLEKHGISPKITTLVHLTYETDNFRRYRTVTHEDNGVGITSPATFKVDALVTTDNNHALFLALADCIAAVIHDTTNNILMMSHLGRHNLEQTGGTKSIEYLVDNFNVDPSNLTVWLSPAAGKGIYPLFSFDNRSLHEVATEQLINGGVKAENITASPIDTTTDLNYFSHSEFLKGNRETDGRFAVVAMLQ